MTAPVKVEACPGCGTKNRIPAVAHGTPRCGKCHRPLPWVVDAGEDDFREVVEAATVPVLVDLWAPWCGPCRMVSPVLERLAVEKAGNLKLVKVDVDRAPRISERFGVQGIPTLLLVRDGKVVAEKVGAAPEGVLRAWIDRELGARTSQ